MDRFRLDDPDAAEKAVEVFYAAERRKGGLVLPPNPEAMQAVLDAIEQPRLPTRSEVETDLPDTTWNVYERAHIATVMIEQGWATEDPEPEVDPAQAMLNLLREARDELNRWGWGDFHYGETGQEPLVVAMVARIDAVLASGRVQVTPQ